MRERGRERGRGREGDTETGGDTGTDSDLEGTHEIEMRIRDEKTKRAAMGD